MANYSERPHGKGSVWKDEARGVWRGQVNIGGKRRSVSGRRRGDVERALDELLEGGGPPAADDEENPTVGAFLTLWVSELADTESENNRANRQWAAERLAPLHSLHMDAVRAQHVEAVLKRDARAGYARTSLVRMRTVLAMAYDTYNGRAGHTFNPGRAAHIPKTVERAEKHALTPEQAAALLEAAEQTPRVGLLVTLGLWLGLRPGEVAGLTWDAVNLAAGELTVCQMRRREPDGSLTMTDAKSKSDRTLHLPPPVVDALRRHKRAQAAEQLAAKTWADNDLVICGRTGAPLDPSNVRREVRKMAEAAGIFFGLTPNELRHTAASLLVEAGVPLTTVADMLGHKNVRMLALTYRHKVARVVDTSGAMSAVLAAV